MTFRSLCSVTHKSSTPSGVDCIADRGDVVEYQSVSKCALSLLFLIGLISLLLGSATARAVEKTVTFNIPRLAADDALPVFGQQADVTVVYRYDRVRDHQTNRLQGEFTVDQAISILLENTGLIANISAGGHLVITQDNNQEGRAMNTKKSLLAAMVGFFVGSGGVQGEDLPEPTAPEKGGVDRELVEIVVTATRREQTIQEVPLSITAFGEEALKTLGASSFEDYARYTPGLSFFHRSEWSRSFQPIIRGIELGRRAPTTAFLIDDIPLQPLEFSRTGLPDPQMYDVSRVEVLKGPQGTLFGAGAMGGAIRVIPNAPDSTEFAARLGADFHAIYNGGPGYEVNGMINIPLIEDKLAVRMVGTVAGEDGWIRGVDGPDFIAFAQDFDFSPQGSNTPSIEPFDNIEALASDDGFLNSEEFYSFRIAAEWNLTDRLTLSPRYYTQRQSQDHGRQISPSAFERNEEKQVFPVFGGVTGVGVMESDILSLTLEYEVDWADISGYLATYETDADRTGPYAGRLLAKGVPIDRIDTDLNIPLLDDIEEEHLIGEVKLGTTFEGPFNFTVGLFRRDVDRVFRQFIGGVGLSEFRDTDVEIAFLETQNLIEDAAFGEVRYEPTEAWEFTLGIRWYDYELNGDLITEGNLAADRITGVAEESGSNLSGSLAYKPTGNFTVYSRIAEGFRPGTVTNGAAPPECGADLAELGLSLDDSFSALESDEVINYEIGVKSQLFDGRMQLNIAGYYIDWTDIQVDIRLDCGFGLIRNAGNATVSGFEADGIVAVTDNIDVNFAVGLVDTELGEDQPALGGLEGDPLPNVSEWNGSAGIQYNWVGLGVIDGGYLRADVSYTDDALYNFRVRDPRPRDIKEKVTLVNLKAGFNYRDWSFSVYAQNALNEIQRGQCRDASSAIPNERLTCTNTPRSIGLSIDRNF